MLEKLRELGIRDDLIDEIKNFVKVIRQKNLMRQEFQSWSSFIMEKMCGSRQLQLFYAGRIFCLSDIRRQERICSLRIWPEFLCGRWDVSFHVNMDAASLIGMDTFRGGEVTFRPGPVYTAAKTGGFTVLDEINMAKSEAMAVLHATLDFRRTIDVPGYERIELHPATRFIATMNYGYSGTKELNEALVSRFAVIQMPMIAKESLIKLIRKELLRQSGKMRQKS